MKYLLITILTPIQNDDTSETRKWFNNLPRESLYSADIIKQSMDDLKNSATLGGVAIQRAIEKKGWPKTGNWSLIERMIGFFKSHFHNWKRSTYGYLS